MNGLCTTRDPEMWDTGNGGNRLALALCAVCPVRVGTTCAAGEPDDRPTGVIRAGVAYNERGGVCPVCDRCGYPVDDLPDRRRPTPPGCRHCRVPQLGSWARQFLPRNEYEALCHRRRMAKRRAARAAAAVPTTTTEETRAA
ncbi:hypothetical protein [Micromonospora endolithica]|uniref:4Fe-4S Wbl-type domain-containing protein n=1 Tax=Micromonospora endolithica TaxID=230091 RepID=A0A3A9YQV9_9ACTN|nr:hypothetical protein [Micromonospora endolithica]RKN38471.1 hypothetical protein D7223_31195 [Micromonospora endolithica]TWJ23106.1 hypothetical protein JD76_03235 [Micromonospora endolithica]